MLPPAARLVANLRRSQPYDWSFKGILVDGRVDSQALDLFGAALDTESAQVRVQLVEVLATLGLHLHPRGDCVIVDPRLVALLLRATNRVDDAGLDAERTLFDCVPARLLRPHAAELFGVFERDPARFDVGLLAKAQVVAARPYLMARSPMSVEDRHWLEIFLAACGDAEMEERYIRTFLDTRDPRLKSRAATDLARIGTPRALKALASDLRTDIVLDDPPVHRSLRVDILEALSFAYPDDDLFNPELIWSDADYAKIERHCESLFGVRWKKPRPPFLTREEFWPGRRTRAVGGHPR